MPNTLIWTVVPHGFDKDGRARLSLVASPRLQAGRLGATPMADWPRLVAGRLGRLALRLAETGDELPLTVVNGSPDAGLWSAIFRPDSTVAAPPAATDVGHFDQLVGSYPHSRAATAARELYDRAMATSPTERMADDHDVTKAVSALTRLTGALGGDATARAAAPVPAGAMDLLDPARLTTARLDRAVDQLRAAGMRDEATAAPLAAVVARHRLATAGLGTGRARARQVVGPGPLDGVGAIENADFHQMMTVLAHHPAIRRMLGLVLDLVVDVSPTLLGTHTVRVVQSGGGLPLAGAFDEVRSMWSRVTCAAPTRFVMATKPTGGVEEMRDGMLDLRRDASGADRFTVTDLDVDSIARQLVLAAVPDAARSGAAVGAPAGFVLPDRRDVGLRLSQVRGSEAIFAAVASASVLFEQAGEQIDGESVLHADDVLAGYRVDVKRNGDPFRSLMRRVVRYTAGRPVKGSKPVEVHDEGTVEPHVAVQQTDGFGRHTLTASEEVFAWSGYGLAAPRPGPVVLADGGAGAMVGDPVEKPLPGFDLQMAVATEPGSLPMLRYGDTYQLRARGTDLAGNALEVDDPAIDPAAATPPVVFRRHQRVATPTIVPRRAFRDGETLVRLVVRSDGRTGLIDPTAERHLAAPSSSQELAERHGMFDSAFGPDSPARAAARRAMLQLARRESGAFTDPVVPATNGSGPVPAPGIAVVAPPGETPATLPPRPGEPLPAGQYVVHDTDAPHLPYLPDPAASGAALIPPGPGRPVPMPYGGTWPAVPPGRLILSAARLGTPVVTVKAGTAGGRGTLAVAVAPGREVVMELASTITPAAAAVMDPLPADAPDSATSGKAVLLSQRQPIAFVHATRSPIADPTLSFRPPERKKGDTDVAVTADLGYDGPSTATVDLDATWSDVHDTGSGPLATTTSKAVLTSVRIDDKTSAVLSARIEHVFGDTVRREVTVTPVAATRFRDCFPELPAGHPDTLRAGRPATFVVPNSRVPAPPQIHSVVPIFQWQRTSGDGSFTSTRRTGGLRIYLERPYLTTGAGEALGVVVFTTREASTAAANEDRRTTELVSRYGGDRLGGSIAGRFFTDMSSGSRRDGFIPVELGGSAAANALAVYEHPVQFDAERDLWFTDVRVDSGPTVPYFLRLALVRYQHESVDGCRASRIVHTDWIPIPVTQSVTVVRQSATSAQVTVHHVSPGRFEASLQPRLLPPPPGAPKGAAPTDITTATGGVHVALPVVTLPGSASSAAGDEEPGSQAPPPQFIQVARGTIGFDPARSDAAALAAGRLIVRQVRAGFDIRSAHPVDADPQHVVWMETLDWKALGSG